MITKVLPKSLWKRSTRTGQVICQCGRGYGSNFDGLCYTCRGMTAWEAKQLCK